VVAVVQVPQADILVTLDLETLDQTVMLEEKVGMV
jgi:hypothetical protein